MSTITKNQVIGFGFEGPVGPKGMTQRCTFAFDGSQFLVASVSAGMKPVPVSRLVGAVCVTVAGSERAKTWGADHWQAQARTVPAHIRHMIVACKLTGDQLALLSAMATFFEAAIPAAQ